MENKSITDQARVLNELRERFPIGSRVTWGAGVCPATVQEGGIHGDNALKMATEGRFSLRVSWDGYPFAFFAPRDARDKDLRPIRSE